MNALIANRLREVAALLGQQAANQFRIRAYEDAAARIERYPRPLSKLLEEGGEERLRQELRVGERLASSIRELIVTGRLGILDRLRGEMDPAALLRTVPGIGGVWARRLVDELNLESLEDLEAAAHDDRLANLAFGPKRLAAIRDSLAQRLGRSGPRPVPAEADPISVSELLDVDREYRESAAAGHLRKIAPRRFNPKRSAWLPILHTERGPHHYTALYSNTARAHDLARTDDWVVIYCDHGRSERQWTVVTETRGPLEGRRVVRGREPECIRFYAESHDQRSDAGVPAGPDDSRGLPPGQGGRSHAVS